MANQNTDWNGPAIPVEWNLEAAAKDAVANYSRTFGPTGTISAATLSAGFLANTNSATVLGAGDARNASTVTITAATVNLTGASVIGGPIGAAAGAAVRMFGSSPAEDLASMMQRHDDITASQKQREFNEEYKHPVLEMQNELVKRMFKTDAPGNFWDMIREGPDTKFTRGFSATQVMETADIMRHFDFNVGGFRMLDPTGTKEQQANAVGSMLETMAYAWPVFGTRNPLELMEGMSTLRMGTGPGGSIIQSDPAVIKDRLKGVHALSMDYGVTTGSIVENMLQMQPTLDAIMGGAVSTITGRRDVMDSTFDLGIALERSVQEEGRRRERTDPASMTQLRQEMSTSLGIVARSGIGEQTALIRDLAKDGTITNAQLAEYERISETEGTAAGDKYVRTNLLRGRSASWVNERTLIALENETSGERATRVTDNVRRGIAEVGTEVFDMLGGTLRGLGGAPGAGVDRGALDDAIKNKDFGALKTLAAGNPEMLRTVAIMEQMGSTTEEHGAFMRDQLDKGFLGMDNNTRTAIMQVMTNKGQSRDLLTGWRGLDKSGLTAPAFTPEQAIKLAAELETGLGLGADSDALLGLKFTDDADREAFSGVFKDVANAAVLTLIQGGAKGLQGSWQDKFRQRFRVTAGSAEEKQQAQDAARSGTQLSKLLTGDVSGLEELQGLADSKWLDEDQRKFIKGLTADTFEKSQGKREKIAQDVLEGMIGASTIGFNAQVTAAGEMPPAAGGAGAAMAEAAVTAISEGVSSLSDTMDSGFKMLADVFKSLKLVISGNLTNRNQDGSEETLVVDATGANT